MEAMETMGMIARGADARPSWQVDLDDPVDDTRGIEGDGQGLVDVAAAGSQIEVEAVPRADDRTSLEPAFAKRTVLVRAGRTRRIAASPTRVEDRQWQAAAR